MSERSSITSAWGGAGRRPGLCTMSSVSATSHMRTVIATCARRRSCICRKACWHTSTRVRYRLMAFANCTESRPGGASVSQLERYVTFSRCCRSSWNIGEGVAPTE